MVEKSYTEISTIIIIVVLKGEFREENFNTAMAVLKDGESSKGDERNKKGGVKGELDYILYFH